MANKIPSPCPLCGRKFNADEQLGFEMTTHVSPNPHGGVRLILDVTPTQIEQEDANRNR